MKLPTISIKGKEYVMVKDRLMAFQELYPEGSIVTEILKNDDKSVVVKATVKVFANGPECVYTGHSEAYRSGPMGQVAMEVSETSAVGRALAMLGIGIIESVSSADEMNKVSTFAQKVRNNEPTSIVDYQELTENNPDNARIINDAKKEFKRSPEYKSKIVKRVATELEDAEKADLEALEAIANQ